MQRQSVSFQGREFDIAYRPAVQFQSYYVISAQHQLKCPNLPAPKVIAMPCITHYWFKVCAAPLARGSGRRPDPPQEQRLAVVMVSIIYGERGSVGALENSYSLSHRSSVLNS